MQLLVTLDVLYRSLNELKLLNEMKFSLTVLDVLNSTFRLSRVMGSDGKILCCECFQGR